MRIIARQRIKPNQGKKSKPLKSLDSMVEEMRRAIEDAPDGLSYEDIIRAFGEKGWTVAEIRLILGWLQRHGDYVTLIDPLDGPHISA